MRGSCASDPGGQGRGQAKVHGGAEDGCAPPLLGWLNAFATVRVPAPPTDPFAPASRQGRPDDLRRSRGGVTGRPRHRYAAAAGGSVGEALPGSPEVGRNAEARRRPRGPTPCLSISVVRIASGATVQHRMVLGIHARMAARHQSPDASRQID
eukprot:scaffold1548_cov117-Isochrysis_galbana.AAC.5